MPAPSNGSAGKNVNVTTLCVKSLAGKLKHDEVLNYFSAFGFVNHLRIRNKTKQSYAFVKFTSPESIVKTLEVEFPKIAGRGVKITVAKDKHQDRTALLDLNDDCILEILSTRCLSIMDLCSVAETCSRLKKIATRVFGREHKSCDIYSLSKTKTKTAKRILLNFGSVISDLKIEESFYFGEKCSRQVLNSVTKYCGNALESLHLTGFDITENLAAKLRPTFSNLRKLQIFDCVFEDASKDLFAHCGSLSHLETCEDAEYICSYTFPKLQRFVCNGEPYWNANLLKSFVSRHSNLKSLKITLDSDEDDEYDEDDEDDEGDESSAVLSSIAQCERLEELKCYIAGDGTLDLSNLGHLTKLCVCCGHNEEGNERSVSKATRGLDNLKFLKDLKVKYAQIDSQFITNLSHLKELQVLRLKHCTTLQNLYRSGELHQLTTLEIKSYEYIDLDIILLIKRLCKLTDLLVKVRDFEIDAKKYSRIVDVVRRRPDRSKLTFRLQCSDEDQNYDNLLPAFASKAHVVEMVILPYKISDEF